MASGSGLMLLVALEGGMRFGAPSAYGGRDYVFGGFRLNPWVGLRSAGQPSRRLLEEG
jgi:hypothetical protein